MTDREVGIDALSVYIPHFYLDLKDMAQANGVDPDKYYVGLGGKHMAILPPDEDPVTMAAEAAKALVESWNIDKKSIGMVIVGTESSVDGAKPIASFVHGLLGLPTECRVFDAQHACYGATAGLTMALNWCATRDKKALIIATDVARYDVRSAGEPTQGAGAVAMVISSNPSLLKIRQDIDAAYSNHVFDFFRPLYRSTAVVDGKFSLECYLTALECTYERFKKQTGLNLSDLDFLLFHVPFPKMAYKAFARLYEIESKERSLPPLSDIFEDMTGCALWANREVGNIYSGSLYLALAGLLETPNINPATKKVGMFSYGSGCCAEFLLGEFKGDQTRWKGKTGLIGHLSKRVKISYEEYIKIREAYEGKIPLNTLSLGNGSYYKYCGIIEHKRIYDNSSSDAPPMST